MEYRLRSKSLPDHICDILKMIEGEFKHYPWIAQQETIEKNMDWLYTWKITLPSDFAEFRACQGEFKGWINHETTPQEVMTIIWDRAHCAISDVCELASATPSKSDE